MKVARLEIDSFRHLENLTFDFTYQSGPKKGQPLDKICFIGQSATGKTSLLELIYEQVFGSMKVELIDGKSLAGFRNEYKKLNGKIEILFGENVFIHNNEEVYYNDRKYLNSGSGGVVTQLIYNYDKKNILYFKANLISEKNIDIFTKNPIDLFEKYSEETSLNLENLLNSKNVSGFFNDEVDPKMWLFLLQEILQYRKKFNQKMSELIHKGLLANPNKLSSEFKKWEKDNPNKLVEFAEKFNPILEKLNLEIDIIDTEYSIPIKNKSTDEIIPIQDSSTGTKGLLLSFLPLYKLDTKDSIIIIDEPERSLYPDMQMELIQHYNNFAPMAQFIVATHSPFIAASFEPEERFILYFDEKGKVQFRNGVSPIGDDPNDILKNDFGLEYLMNSKGIEAYKKYLDLKQKMASEKDEKKKKELLKEVVSLGDKYMF